MSTAPFTYEMLAGRVRFGVGARHDLAAEAAWLGANRILVVASEYEDAIAEEVTDILGDLVVGRFSDVVQHVPVKKADAARRLAADLDVDTLVSIGGGSATGLAKAVALELDVRQLAVPTTYAGSEMTAIWGLTDGDRKETGIAERVKPDVVVYDPELTVTLPPEIAGPSGMNALAHCVEALYGPGANPVTSAMALEGIAALVRSLPTVCAHPADLEARSDALYGAHLAGVALAVAGTALHHKTCHVLGGMFDLNHGDMNAVLLPHALAYNAPAMPEVMSRIEVAVDSDDAPVALFELVEAIGSPTSLERIGMPAAGLDEATERVVVAAADNVRTPDERSIREMLDAAFEGRRPS